MYKLPKTYSQEEYIKYLEEWKKELTLLLLAILSRNNNKIIISDSDIRKVRPDELSVRRHKFETIIERQEV